MIAGVNSVSVLAHSFGTYIAMNYIMGFEWPPMLFDTIILVGAILDVDLDFTSLNGKVGHVINEIAPNDEWAEWVKVVNFGRDEMFGNAATVGFNYTGDRLTQHRSTIFTHNNVIRRDVMVARWMPAIEADTRNQPFRIRPIPDFVPTACQVLFGWRAVTGLDGWHEISNGGW